MACVGTFAEMHKQIAKATPGLQMWVVGKDPVPEVKAYAKIPNVTVTGGVPECGPIPESLAAGGADPHRRRHTFENC